MVQEKSPASVHIMVALCDNTYQGIVPVPKGIGNGQNPATNLYWGCGYGIKTYFKKSAEWTHIRTEKIDSTILERMIFKHKNTNTYLIADAYNGKYIKQCTIDFLKSNAGQMNDTVMVGKTVIGTHGKSKLLAYIGHDGLMDFELENTFHKADDAKRDCIILACYSKNYFSTYITSAGSQPLVWTTGLMCPEAYTVHDAISAYLKGEPRDQVRLKAAEAYNKYQKCGLKGAQRLLVGS